MNATVEMGICPVCNGSARVPAGDTQYKKIMTSYDPDTDTFACRNCGGQTMSCSATGRVRLRPDGTPCTHEYTGQQLGNCYWQYTCVHCGDRHSIDSGD
jgi:hypothetical protein